MKSIRQLIDEVKAASPNWDLGANLTFLNVSQEQLRDLGNHVLAIRRRGLAHLSTDDQRLWGAALFLVGTQAFTRSEAGPFTYERIWQLIGEHAPSPFVALEYNAIEGGVARIWGLSIPRSRGERQFQGTMLYNSGGGWPVLGTVCTQVSRRWSWEGIQSSTLEQIATWLLEIRDSNVLPDRFSKTLELRDSLYAMSQRLQKLADARHLIVQRGLIRDDLQATVSALKEAALNLRELFDAPSEESAIGLLPALLQMTTGRGEVPSAAILWHWELSTRHIPYLSIEIPEHILIPDLPPEVERIHIQILNSGKQGPEYVRTNGHFSHLKGPKRLYLPDPASFPVEVVASYQQVAHTRELLIRRLPFPCEPVATFITESGKLVPSAPAMTRVALVCAPGLNLEEVEGFSRTLSQGLETWLGSVPTSPMPLKLCKDGESLPWILAPTDQRLSIELTGAEIPGLRFGLAQAFARWPSFVLEGGATARSYRLVGPGGEKQGVIRGRGGLLHVLPDTSVPGLYQLQVLGDRVAWTGRFAVLTPEFKPTAESASEGTRIRAPGFRIRQLDGPHHGQAEIQLSPSVEGPVEFVLTQDSPQLASLPRGHWTLFASPPAVYVVETRGGSPLAGSLSLSLLHGLGGLELMGPPASKVTVSIRFSRWELQLDAQGRRFFPFSALPRELTRSSAKMLVIEVRIGSQLERKLGPFHNEAEQRARHKQVRTSDGQDRVRISLRSELGGDIHLEAVSPRELWAPPFRVKCTRLPDSDGCWYEAPLPDKPGSYLVALMQEERRVSGMAKVVRSDSPPEGVSELSGPRACADNPARRVIESFESTPVNRQAFADLRQDVANRMRDNLTALGRAHLIRLLSPFSRYGAQWFIESTTLIDVATCYHLESVLWPDEDEHSERLRDLFAEAEVPLVATRYADLEAVLLRLMAQPGSALVRAMRVLSEAQAGLLLAAWQVWQQHDRFMEIMEPLAPLMSSWMDASTCPLPLPTSQEVDLLRAPADDGLRGLPIRSLRIRGLLEGRIRPGLLQELRGLLQAEPRSRTQKIRDWRSRNLAPSAQNGIPTDLIEIEELVILYAHQVHTWRQGGTVSTKFWSDVRELWAAVPTLMDFWLNRWAILLMPKEK